ncbi:hypothetical protein DPMN_039381 [Dreissena polymorpha]|uniref:Uncharacterized protein n=1 Tax=Dreissena polymorpha TaxID=45954 RepID=A0A9D4MIR4_DREPO|nr:hypothetical protein DPMN_039381 [Dreissena polymorpha]
MSVLRASSTYMVPENTLRDSVLGKVDPETVVMGKVPLFDEFEEAQIVNQFKAMADLGYGYTQQECIDVASQFAVQLGKMKVDTPLSMIWMKGFLKRWPEMRVVNRVGILTGQLSIDRAGGQYPVKTGQYWSLLVNTGRLKIVAFKHDKGRI